MTTTRSQIGWDSIFANGSVVDLDVGIWSARTSIKPADLGIEDTTEVHQVLSLGCHRLAPREAMEPLRVIAAAAKRKVEFYSLTFGFIKGARFVPAARLDELLEKLRGFKSEFDAAVDAFVFGTYAQAKAAQMPVIRAALTTAARTPEAAEFAFNRIVSEYPSPEKVKQKFSLRWNVYAVRASASSEAAQAASNETTAVLGVVQEMVMQLREEFTERVRAIMAAVARGGRVIPQTIQATKDVLDRIEAMNVCGDRALDEQVARLRAIVRQVEQAQDSGALFRTDSGVMSELTQIQASVERSAAQAVIEAEANLTAVGRRRFAAGGAA